MFDGVFDVFAEVLNFFYTHVPNYAIAIALLTLLVMVITTPFTLKGTRSMIQMQRLQPEMRKLQVKYKDDRQQLNEELMAFYKENNLNPLGGCLPLLLQTPIFIILYNVIRGLTRIGPDGTFDPKYLKHSSDLYQSLTDTDEMMAFGVDLATSASKALQEGFLTGLPHVVMVVIVALTSYYQQKQIQGRNPNVEMPPQQKMLMRVFPAMFVVIAFVSPSALVVYFITSNLYRIGMQAYITRTLYHGEDSLGAQAQRATAEAKRLKEEEGSPGLLPRIGKRAAAGRRRRTNRRRSRRTRRRSAATEPMADRGSRPRRPLVPHRLPRTGPRRRSGGGSRTMEWVETTGKTVEEAKDAALDQLGVDEQDAEFELVEEPRTGLFGRTRGEARVRARVRPTQPRPKVDRRGRSGRAGRSGERRRASGGDRSAKSAKSTKAAAAGSATAVDEAPRIAAPTADATAAPAPEATPKGPGAGEGRRRRGGRGRGRDDQAADRDDEQETKDMTETELAEQGEVVRGFLVDLLDAFGLDGEVTATPAEEGAVELAVGGEDLGLLIGPKGATLQALQELSRSMLQRTRPGETHARVRVDVGGYRARRREALEAFVRKVAEDVVASGAQKALEPMAPPDRKVVHDTVNDIPGVHTVSEGEDARRRVVIIPD